MAKDTLRYHCSQSGRVKAAGIPLSLFTDGKDLYQGTLNSAANMYLFFLGLRKSPPETVRDRFFPRSSDTKAGFISGANLPRTALTTHQGVGQFLTYKQTDMKNQPLNYHVQKQTGLAIVEEHFADQLLKHPSHQLQPVIEAVQRHYSERKLPETQNAYEQLMQKAQALGIQVQREVQVGREGFFFICPSVAKRNIELPKNIGLLVNSQVAKISSAFEDLALDMRNRFAIANSMPAIGTKPFFPPLYFQADMYLDNDNHVEVSDIHLPDVGFFLKALKSDNPVVAEAKKTVEDTLENLVRSIGMLALEHHSKKIRLVTRPEVISNCQDTLEINELRVISSRLAALGLPVDICDTNELTRASADQLYLLMNVDVLKDPDFHAVLRKRLKDESVPMYPDPFLLLAKDRLTQHKEISFRDSQFQNSFKPHFAMFEKFDHKTAAYTVFEAVQQSLRKLGIPDDCDIFHMYLPFQPTAIPIYRYDLKGLQIALNYANDSDSVIIRCVPQTKEKAVLFDNETKPIYAVFRYMFSMLN